MNPLSVPAACEKVISLIADYLNGELDPNLQARFERHLSQCPECLAYVNTYRQTIYLLHTLPDDSNFPSLNLFPGYFLPTRSKP